MFRYMLEMSLTCYRNRRQSTKELLKGYVALPLFPGKGGDSGFNVGYSLLNLIENHIWLPKFLYLWITNTSYRTIIGFTIQPRAKMHISPRMIIGCFERFSDI